MQATVERQGQRLIGGASDLDLESLSHEPELEQGRFFRVRVDQEHLGQIFAQAPSQVFAGDQLHEEVDQVRIENRASIAAEHLKRLGVGKCLSEGVAGIERQVRKRVAHG